MTLAAPVTRRLSRYFRLLPVLLALAGLPAPAAAQTTKVLAAWLRAHRRHDDPRRRLQRRELFDRQHAEHENQRRPRAMCDACC